MWKLYRCRLVLREYNACFTSTGPPMHRPILAAIILAVALPAAQAQSSGSWTVSIRQDGRTVGHSATAALKKAPFTLVFEGAKDLGYAIVSGTRCDELAGLKTPEQIFDYTNPMAAAAESRDRSENTLLNVSTPKALKSKQNQWNNWGEDAESEQFSFQTFIPSRDGNYIGQREIKSIYVDGDAKESGVVPIEKFAGSQICMLVTGLPPVGHLAHVEPKLMRITF